MSLRSRSKMPHVGNLSVRTRRVLNSLALLLMVVLALRAAPFSEAQAQTFVEPKLVTISVNKLDPKLAVPEIYLSNTVPASVAPNQQGGPITAAGLLYSIGDPTDAEQLYLELINRTRRQPQVEALSYRNTRDSAVRYAFLALSVDLDLMQNQFSSLLPKPPLSFNANLIQAARRHSSDMMSSLPSFQSHTGSDGSTPLSRVQASGYTPGTSPLGTFVLAENIYASAASVFHGHVAFDVDWGSGAGSQGGMQVPPLHRQAIHSTSPLLNFKELGVGVSTGGFTSHGLGPQWVTQLFSSRSTITPFVTGVAYYDVNGDGAYSVGEGIGGLTVSSPGSTYSAVTSNSGGYSLPVPANGAYQVTFGGYGFISNNTASVSIANGDNSKLDFVPAYSMTSLTGPSTAELGSRAAFTFQPIAGSTGYFWRSLRISPPRVEGAENGIEGMELSINSAYSALGNAPYVASGSHSFHLAHVDNLNEPGAAVRPQFLKWDLPFMVNSSSVLRFSSCVAWAAASQRASVWVGVEGNETLEELPWEQRGLGHGTMCSFSTQQISLAKYAGKLITFYFKFEVDGLQYYSGSDGAGWYFDDLNVVNALETQIDTLTDIQSQASFEYAPTETGSFLLQVSPTIGARTIYWGVPFQVNVAQAIVAPGVPGALAVN